MEAAELTGVAVSLLVVAALIFANAFFVASEFALVTVRKTRMDELVSQGHSLAPIVRRALTNPDKYLAAVQLGITMASLALGWIGEPALAALIEPGLRILPPWVSVVTAHSIAFGTAFAVITSVHIVLGEQVPKIMALQYAEPIALYSTKVIELFMKACWPLIATLNWVTNRMLAVFGLKRFSGHPVVHSEDELKMLVTASQEAGVLEEQEEQMLHRVFGFGNITAAHVMVPRTAIAALPVDANAVTVVDRVSRGTDDVIPVYRDGLDDIVGVVHVRHLLGPVSSDPESFTLADHVLEIPAVPLNMTAGRLLARMRQAMTHHAVVMDEFGGTAGLVTFGDLMERIVGTAGGDHDLKGLRMTRLADGSAMLDGLMLVNDLNEHFGMHVDFENYTSVGGYVLGRLGRRPMIGDEIEVEGMTLRVEALDGLRVAWIMLSPTARIPAESLTSHVGNLK
jgi:CBS domain containing-hemolysin-like protein